MNPQDDVHKEYLGNVVVGEKTLNKYVDRLRRILWSNDLSPLDGKQLSVIANLIYYLPMIKVIFNSIGMQNVEE